MLKNLSYPDSVRPEGWINPDPADKYDLVVIGGGPAGLVSAIGGAKMGARVALVEKNLLGGDCLNYGCTPSKALIESARRARDVDTSEVMGINVDSCEIDFSSIMDSLRALRASISSDESAVRIMSEGVDLFLGEASFDSPSSVLVDGVELKFTRAIIATGAKARVPAIEGLAEAGYLTNETLFEIEALPPRLVIIGGGPIACEMGQAFQRLGSKVTIIHHSERLLSRDDEEASDLITYKLRSEGLDIKLSSEVQRVLRDGETKEVFYSSKEGEGELLSVKTDEILIAAGRVPSVENLDLEKALVDYDDVRGIIVNDQLQTSNEAIYGAGDCCLKYRFTHAADAAARICLRNAFFPGNSSFSKVIMPWCTYTSPEVAHVGLSKKDLEEMGKKYKGVKISLKDIHRSTLKREDEGFLKVLIDGRGKILGATLVSSNSGDMISEISVAMKAGMKLQDLSWVVHPYPSEADVFKKAADKWSSRRFSPLMKVFIKIWLLWIGRDKKQKESEAEDQVEQKLDEKQNEDID